MRGWANLVLAVLAISATTNDAPAAEVTKSAATHQDWLRVVEATADGGFRIGNPAAPVKLVEYSSLTCPHCADFAENGAPSLLRDYVSRGKVSFEIRNKVLNFVDFTASLVSRCGGKDKFFALTDSFFAKQADWAGKARSLGPEQIEVIKAAPEEDRAGKFAEMIGILDIAAEHGIGADMARLCLKNSAEMEKLSQMAEASEKMGISGTPSFTINGIVVDVHDWSALEPLIRQAGG